MAYDARLDTPAGTTWSGSHRYSATAVHHPRSADEVIELVRGGRPVRPIGTGHTFNELSDGSSQIRLDRLPMDPVLDESARTVTFGGGTTYGELAPWLHERGWALHNLASLPHISVAGAVATGTHGSGDAYGSLATAVAGLELVTGAGENVRLTRRDADLAGAVVSLGALGVVTRLTMNVEPTYDAAQVVYTDLPWDGFDYDRATTAGDSVSLFTSWQSETIGSMWVIRRQPGDPFPATLAGGVRQTEDLHPTRLEPATNTTAQCGVPGPWYERLPHFRLGFTPSTGAELQTEYLLPREAAAEAFTAMRAVGARLGDRLARLLIISEMRSVAADDLWLSGAYGRATVAIHLTWRLDLPGVTSVLPELDAALLPLDARPHWGKLHLQSAADLDARYPRWADFAALRDRYDPQRLFSNPYLDRLLGR